MNKKIDTEVDKKELGLFIGMSSLPNYSSEIISLKDYEKRIIVPTFGEFRKELKNNIVNSDNLPEILYKPIIFYALGSFNLISLSFIDDFHFGNFSFRPYNRHIDPNSHKEANFQYQVINNYKLDYSGNLSFDDINTAYFIGVCKLKINSSLLIGVGCNAIRETKTKILEKYGMSGTKILMSESFSWHELTLVLFGSSLDEIMQTINDIRHETVKSFGININNAISTDYKTEGEVNVFSDSGTTLGVNPLFFGNHFTYLEDYMKSGKDSNVFISSKLNLKAGHASQFRELIKNDKIKELINVDSYKFINGRSDYSLKYREHSVINYLNFWNIIQNDEELSREFHKHVQKYHSNISIPYESNIIEPLETNLHKKIFSKLKFNNEDIKEIETSLKSLKVSKDVANTVITVFTTFNDIICDVNLYSFFIDLKSILTNLHQFILSLEGNVESKMAGIDINYRKVSIISSQLLSFVDTFNTAYRNRFLDSKRNGYNLDIKGAFNGGVHQILQAYDSLFKISCDSLRLTKPDLSRLVLPIVSYGGSGSGIKSNIMTLHLNYFQLFQPEFFLFSLRKESINYLISKSIIEPQDGIPTSDLLRINEFKQELSFLINNEPNIKRRSLIYKYLPLHKLRTKINYILYYLVFIKIQWEDDIESFSFWLWNSYIQNSNLYNIDGSLRIDLLREHFFAYFIALKYIYPAPASSDSKYFDFNSLKKIIKSPEINFHLFDSENPIIKEVEEVRNSIYNYEKPHENDSQKMTLTRLLSASVGLITNLKGQLDVEKGNSFSSEISELINKYLQELKKLIIDDESMFDDSILSYIRDTKTGNGLASDKYGNVVFDPHGGIFVRDPKLRIKFFNQRIKIMNKARDISYRYKKNLI